MKYSTQTAYPHNFKGPRTKLLLCSGCGYDAMYWWGRIPMLLRPMLPPSSGTSSWRWRK